MDFEVAGIRPGSYLLRPSVPLGWLVRSITHRGQDMTERPLVLHGGERIDAVVVELTDESASLAGSVADAIEPSARVTVVIFPRHRGAWEAMGLRPPWLRIAAADVAGRYVAARLPAGEYYVAAIEGTLPPDWASVAFLERLADIAVERDLDWGDDVLLDLTAYKIR
jgi:hypothetical protein